MSCIYLTVRACVPACVRACLPAFVRVCVHLNTGLYWVCVQGGVAEPADRTREINERLLAEVRRRLQEAKSQLPSGAGAGAAAGSPDEADEGTPEDSPLGGRPKVLQGQGSAGIYSSNSLHCILVLLLLYRPVQDSFCILAGSSYKHTSGSCATVYDILDDAFNS